jgi:hypothetical protein
MESPSTREFSFMKNFFNPSLIRFRDVVGEKNWKCHACPYALLVINETWCDTQSNAGIAIYEYLSKLTEKQTIVVPYRYKATKTLGDQVKWWVRVMTSQYNLSLTHQLV